MTLLPGHGPYECDNDNHRIGCRCPGYTTTTTKESTMPNIIDATTEFTRLAELPEGIRLDNLDIRRLRIRLLHEEFKEYLDGENAEIVDGDPVICAGLPDPVEIADGLADVIVIAWGTLLAYFGEACATAICREVWSSNLSKVDGSMGPIVRREDGKLLKPEGWTPPNIAEVLRQHGFSVLR